MCFPIEAVQNCKKHDISYSIKLSTYNCVECEEDFYLISNFCIERTPIENCSKYDPLDDACLQCSEGFALNNSVECEESIIMSSD